MEDKSARLPIVHVRVPSKDAGSSVQDVRHFVVLTVMGTAHLRPGLLIRLSLSVLACRCLVVSMLNNECATTLSLHVCAGMDEDDCVWSQVHCVHYRGQRTWSLTSWICCTNIR